MATFSSSHLLPLLLPHFSPSLSSLSVYANVPSFDTVGCKHIQHSHQPGLLKMLIQRGLCLPHIEGTSSSPPLPFLLPSLSPCLLVLLCVVVALPVSRLVFLFVSCFVLCVCVCWAVCVLLCFFQEAESGTFMDHPICVWGVLPETSRGCCCVLFFSPLPLPLPSSRPHSCADHMIL